MDLHFRNIVAVRLETRSQNKATGLSLKVETRGVLLCMCIYVFVSVEVSFTQPDEFGDKYTAIKPSPQSML